MLTNRYQRTIFWSQDSKLLPVWMTPIHPLIFCPSKNLLRAKNNEKCALFWSHFNFVPAVVHQPRRESFCRYLTMLPIFPLYKTICALNSYYMSPITKNSCPLFYQRSVNFYQISMFTAIIVININTSISIYRIK